MIVGFLMLTQVRSIDLTDHAVAIPAFLTIVVMPFTYSISAGIGAGSVSCVLIAAVTGRARTVHPLLWLVSVLFVACFAIAPPRSLLGVG